MKLFDNTMLKIHVEISLINGYTLIENTYIDTQMVDTENYHSVINWIKKIYEKPIYDSGGLGNISYRIDRTKA